MLFNISKPKRQCFKLLLLSIFTASCTNKSNFEFDRIYRKELEMIIDNVKVKGVYVAPKQEVYKMHFQLPDKPNVVKFTTCHREETFRDVGNKLELEYRPVHGLEDTGSCLVEVAAFDDEGAHLWGLIDFEDSEKLATMINCNGATYVSKGVSICQSKAGLIQKLTFALPVRAFSSNECSPVETKDQKTFTYVMGQDKCIYLFSDGKVEHRHTTFGYDEVLIK